jgi:hypothetical protein
MRGNAVGDFVSGSASAIVIHKTSIRVDQVHDDSVVHLQTENIKIPQYSLTLPLLMTVVAFRRCKKMCADGTGDIV